MVERLADAGRDEMERGVDERADGEAAERRSHAVARIVCGKGL